ncbi:arylacetamide deacetylase-like [Haliotis rufescens]|uniref:arylacetamide deacetylase-like n=1 Tax=Haliotis rufescens TaxID=6454 RepID=UPI00201EABEF|nr:arylacetamide deacetylase-like [Haliotis rufescens]XP_046349763.2 arylacetamide deacetylase-like [Haliotis rufescens]XP_046349769.2 arylacetamide deacetylase-like [Haliotis rufescens]
MGCVKVSALLVSVLVTGLSIYLYTPIPDDLEEPWKLRIYTAAFKLLQLVGRVTDSTDCGSYANTLRLLDTMAEAGAFNHKPSPFLNVTDTWFDGVKVRIYRPKSGHTPSPALVYYHGGGWTFGSVALYDRFTRQIAESANILVVSVEYRLAPEHPFPIPFEDCVTATLHLLQNPQQYGVDGNRIAVGGDSAGGNLAAAVALRLGNNKQLPRLSFQMLIYPCVQPLDLKLPSYTNPLNFFATGPNDMAWYWAAYIGQTSHPDLVEAMVHNQHTSASAKRSKYADFVDANANLPKRFLRKETSRDVDYGNETLWAEIAPRATNPYLAPLLAEDFTGVPPSLLVTAEYDVLRDESIMYAQRLRKAGIKVAHRHYIAIHSVLVLDLFEVGRTAIADMARDLQKHFFQ